MLVHLVWRQYLHRVKLSAEHENHAFDLFSKSFRLASCKTARKDGDVTNSPLKIMSASDESKAGNRLRRFSQKMHRSIQQKIAEFDSETDEPVRIIPERLAILAFKTGFTEKQICQFYRAFKQQCPSGAATTSNFRPVYAKLFPTGNPRKYANLVFNAMDEDKDGVVSFADLLTFASTMNQKLDEKLSWIFRLYDLNGDGYITKREMNEYITAVYELIKKSERERNHDKRVNYFFNKMDLNRDGVVSKNEFLVVCKKDRAIKDQLRMFDCKLR